MDEKEEFGSLQFDTAVESVIYKALESGWTREAVQEQLEDIAERVESGDYEE